MYVTQKNISVTPITTDSKSISNKYITYPYSNVERIAEGGLRTKEKYKKALPNKPLLSIITVVYNRVHTLEKCIRSVLNQNYDNVEYIVIDGGSRDGTLELIKQYEDAIDYFISEPDTGIYDAMNKGISLASGDTINFMNSDDKFVENVFAHYAQALQTKNTVAINAKITVLNSKNEMPIVTFAYPTENNFFNYVTVHQTFFIKKEVFNILGYFNTEYKIAADYCFLFSMYMHYGTQLIASLDIITVHYYSDGYSSINLREMLKEVAKAQYYSYGKQLQIPKSFFMNILSSEDIAKYNPLSVLFNLYISTKNSTNKALWEQVFSSFCVFLEEGIHQEYYSLAHNFWFIFGQQNKRKKIVLLCKILMQKVTARKLNRSNADG